MPQAKFRFLDPVVLTRDDGGFGFFLDYDVQDRPIVLIPLHEKWLDGAIRVALLDAGSWSYPDAKVAYVLDLDSKLRKILTLWWSRSKDQIFLDLTGLLPDGRTPQELQSDFRSQRAIQARARLTKP